MKRIDRAIVRFTYSSTVLLGALALESKKFQLALGGIIMLDNNSVSSMAHVEQASSSPSLSLESTDTNKSLAHSSQDESENSAFKQRMRWFLLIVVSLWVFAAMAISIIGFCITKSLLFISFFGTAAPPAYIIYRITKYLFPRDEKDFQLELTKIKHTK